MTDFILKINKRAQPPDMAPIMGTANTPIGPNYSLPEEDSKKTPGDEIRQLQHDVSAAEDDLSDQFFLNRSTQASSIADEYFKTNIKPRLQDAYYAYMSKPSGKSIGAFDTGSPEGFIYRPKTRTIIQKYKAACRASFFTNPDVVSIEAENPSDKTEVVTAQLVKTLLNYRLTKTVPWQNLCVGGFDEAMTSGLCVYYTEWRKKNNVEGPFVDLIPLDNMRWDPSADWTDIVNSSPYLIMLVPYYVGDLLEEMDEGRFEKMTREEIGSTMEQQRKALTIKQPNEMDPEKASAKSGINDYQTVIVRKHIHRIKGIDWVWETLDDMRMLSKPKLLDDVHFHGHRPFVIGSTDIEPHNAYVTPYPELVGGLQEEMNILITQRRTAVDMTINPKWRVDSELLDQLDPKALLDNAPGLVAAPKDSLEMLKIPDVTGNSYKEQQVLDQDFNEISGNFNPQTNLTQKQPTDTPYRMGQMLNSSANMLVDDRLMCFACTAIVPLFRLLILLEQYHETDEVLVGLVGQQAGLFSKHHSGRVDWSQNAKNIMGPVPSDFTAQANALLEGEPSTPQPGMNAAQIAGTPTGAAPTAGQQGPGGGVPQSRPQDASRALPPGVDVQTLLSKELAVKVNVGLNATAPDQKLSRFIAAINQLMEILANPAHVVFDIDELFKEVMALSGYGDGKRFMNQSQNPEVMMLRQQLMQLVQKINNKSPEWQMKDKMNKDRLASSERIKGAELAQKDKELKQEGAVALLEHARELDIANKKLDQMSDQNQPQQPQPQQGLPE